MAAGASRYGMVFAGMVVLLLGVYASAGSAAVRLGASSSGVQASDAGLGQPSLSADGRFVAFASLADNLVPDDTNGRADVFVRDLRTGVTVRVSVSSAVEEADGDSWEPAISADGRWVTFTSAATNLVAEPDRPGGARFVHDLLTGATRAEDTQGPVLSNPFAERRFMKWNYAYTWLEVRALSPKGIEAAWALLALDGGSEEPIPVGFRPKGYGSVEGVWTGLFSAGPNRSVYQKRYHVTFWAKDKAGNKASLDGGFVTIGSRGDEPVISVTPAELKFENTPVGGKTRLTLTIENTGDAPLTGEVSMVSHPFQIMSGGKYFSIDRHEKRKVIVEFHPTKEGVYDQERPLRIESNHGYNRTETRVPISGTAFGTAP